MATKGDVAEIQVRGVVGEQIDRIAREVVVEALVHGGRAGVDAGERGQNCNQAQKSLNLHFPFTLCRLKTRIKRVTCPYISN